MWKKRTIVLGFLLYFLAFWFVFSGIFNLTFALFAIISILISFYLDKAFFFDKDECIIFPSFSFLRYLGVIIQDVFFSAFYVTVFMIKRRGDIPEPCIKVIPIKIKHAHVRSFIENSITITPGTYVIESDDKSLLASAIDQQTMDDLINKKFILKIYSIFKRFNFDS